MTKTNDDATTTTIEGWTFATGYGVRIVSPYFESKDEAIAYASRFPKSIRAKVVTLFCEDGRTRFYVRIGVDQDEKSRASGIANETGARRIRRAIEILRRDGIDVRIRRYCCSNAMSDDELTRRFFA